MGYLSIKQWAADDRPREKLVSKGVSSLSDAELLGILLGSGLQNLSAVELGRNILSLAGNNLSNLGRMGIAELTQTKGIGQAKAITIMAALELGKRRKLGDAPQQDQICSSAAAYEYCQSFLTGLQHEEFWVVFLNTANKVLGHNKVSQGGVSGTVMDIRLILKKALELLASSLVIAHNHPSGNLQPSKQDEQITQKLKQAAAQMDIKLLDHLIVTDHGYYSFSDEGLI